MLEQHTTTHTHHVIYGKRSIYHLTLSLILLLQQDANVLYFLEYANFSFHYLTALQILLKITFRTGYH